MKIAIITPYAPPEKGASTIRVESFRSYFKEKENVVEVFAPMRGGIEEGGEGLVRYKNLRALIGLLRRGEYDAVIGVSTLLTHLFFVVLYCKIRRIPFILDSKEPYIHTLASLGILRAQNPKFKIYNLIERFLYRYSNKIFVLTEFNMEFLIEEYGINREKVVLVMNGTDPNIIRRSFEEGKSVRVALNIPDKAMVFVYAGSLGDEEIEQFLFSANEIIKKYDFFILFILALEDSFQAKNQLKQLMSLIKKLGIEDSIRIVKNVEYEDMYKYLSAGDAGVVPWPNELIFSLPVKIFDYLAAELPVIAKGPETGSMRDFFEKYGIGCYATNWEEFKEKLINIVEKSGEIKNNMRRGLRTIIEEKYNRKKFTAIALHTIQSQKNSR